MQARPEPLPSQADDGSGSARAAAIDKDLGVLGFLTAVLPERGTFFAVTPSESGRGFSHVACATIDEIAGHALSCDARGRNAYFACASYERPSYVDGEGRIRRRTAENAGWVRSFWIDVDCGEDKAQGGTGYATIEDAVRSIGTFLKQTALPPPWVVASGGGLHCYWPLESTITKAEWLLVAADLKQLFARSSPPLLVDQSRTADIASILRVPGTRNWKPERSGARVELLRMGNTLNYSDFRRLVAAALSAVESNVSALTRPHHHESNANFRCQDSESAQFIAKNIIARCNQFRWAQTHQPEVAEPLWRALIGTLYRSDDPETIHAISSQHPAYRRDETEQKARAWKGGGATCEHLESLRPAGCAGCPHKKQIRSPAALGFRSPPGEVGSGTERETPIPQNLFQQRVPQPLSLRSSLPPLLADFAEIRAEVAGHDPTAYAYAAVAAISGVIPHATRVVIGPTWNEPPLLWVAMVGPTGSGKSPAMNAAVAPVMALHQTVYALYRADRAAWEAAKRVGPAPVPSGYYFTDPTIDALIDRAGNADHTVLRHADEGTSWLNTMGRYSAKGDGGERGTWLASWNGTGYTVTRIERGDKSLDAWGVAVLYGITPKNLKEAYADASSDGMLARTLICLTDPARWVPPQHDPSVSSVSARYAQAVSAAAATRRLLHMTSRAEARWRRLRDDYGATAKAIAELVPGLAGFLVKAPTMAVRLAGLFAIIDGATKIRDAHMEWAEEFMRHASATARIAHEQVFAISQPVAIARRLAARILTSGQPRIARRDFERVDAFAKATDAERGAAIDHLAGAGWLLDTDTKRVRLGPRFREATAWLVNPLVHVRFVDIADRERQAAQDALNRLHRVCGA